MSITLSYLLAPLVGGVIGYITNDIAIRMLFHPHKAKYIFGFHVPFTPGLIPKEKVRIAEAIGVVVSDNLMNKEVLEKYLLSEEMVGKLRASVADFLKSQQHNPETLSQFLGHYLSEDEITTLAKTVDNGLAQQIHTKLTDPAIGNNVAHIAVEHVTSKLKALNPLEFLGALGLLKAKVLGGLIGADIVIKLLGLLREPLEKALAKNINEMLAKNGEGIVSQFLGDEISRLLATPVEELLRHREKEMAQAVDVTENVYRHVITEHLPKILDSIDIKKVIQGRIEEMDVAETERLIMQVMNKELRAIVWLGALLGLLMGSVNAFI